MPDQYGLTTEDYACLLEAVLASLKDEPLYGKDWSNPPTPDPWEEDLA